MHAQIDKCAELGDVGHRAFQHHALGQILDVVHALVEASDLEVGARITAGFFQLGEDVLDRDDAEFRVGKGLRRMLQKQRTDHIRLAHQVGHRPLHGGQDALHDGVGFRVHAGQIQRVLAVADSQEACGLLESLGAQARHVEQLLAALERAMGIAPADDGGRHRGRQAGDAGQQRRGRRVQVHADRVHAILDDGAQGARQLALVHVMLVLADADALRVDLDQLGQRVLQAAGDRHRAAQAHVEIGQLVGSKF